RLAGGYAGSILGGLGGWLAESFGWRFGFLLFGAAGVGYALVLSVLLEEPKAPGLQPGGLGVPAFGPTFAALISSPGFQLLLGVNACVGAGFWTLKNWLPTFFNAELGLDLTRAGVYGALVFNAAAFAGMLAAGAAADRWALRTPRARALVPAVGLCLAAPCFLFAGQSAGIATALAAVLVAGVAQGSVDA